MFLLFFSLNLVGANECGISLQACFKIVYELEYMILCFYNLVGDMANESGISMHGCNKKRR